MSREPFPFLHLTYLLYHRDFCLSSTFFKFFVESWKLGFPLARISHAPRFPSYGVAVLLLLLTCRVLLRRVSHVFTSLILYLYYSRCFGVCQGVFQLFLENFIYSIHGVCSCSPLPFPLTIIIIVDSVKNTSGNVAQNYGKNFVQPANHFLLDKLCEVWYNGNFGASRTWARRANSATAALRALIISSFCSSILRSLTAFSLECSVINLMLLLFRALLTRQAQPCINSSSAAFSMNLFTDIFFFFAAAATRL